MTSPQPSRFQASKETAYEYLNKKAFNWGYVPHSDVAAQTRCFTYLEESIAKLEAQILNQSPEDSSSINNKPVDLKIDPNQDQDILKTLKVTLLSTYNLVKPNYGSYSMRNAKMFWSYWDRIKQSVAKVHEGSGATEEQITKILDELEVGRYISVDFSEENKK
ncbi:uncharacterized protein SAPINGB_P003365 [Magnusiomyces paraingens]|uniref:Uncharacterized protein n=1 Tax=Magnusiomyces paraingens TaxID=2606893 RepID=A0A5E8BNZ5_9ASCO|nr:uncharacterized protein SAPINGB_P003365 [Saprochaete ingens]VVT53023.1 unnamed protein product [Saprochaete ingens]